ncbi:DMT family transporter [Ascidiimonas aurantiaca]|uniref:DMT family transporter n=1 Tax=Ascidiimonas aurantiaca TaxID=1685432 RepID=UPI0030ECAF41
MSSKKYLFQLLELNFAMMLISTSGALGRYITLAPPVTILLRAFMALSLLYLFCRIRKIPLFRGNKKDLTGIVFGGIFMGAHWITYFYALQLSNVAIGMLSIFTYPVITAFLEPILLKSRFNRSQLLLALLVLVGIYFLVPEFSLENSYTVAVLLGVLSALFYSLRNIIVKKHIPRYNGIALMWYQLLVITIFLVPVIPFFAWTGVVGQLPAILMLALFTTALGHTLYVMSFRHFSVTTASIMGSLQPLYGIIFGMVFLHEIPSWSTVIGGTLILISVIVEGMRSYRN